MKFIKSQYLFPDHSNPSLFLHFPTKLRLQLLQELRLTLSPLLRHFLKPCNKTFHMWMLTPLKLLHQQFGKMWQVFLYHVACVINALCDLVRSNNKVSFAFSLRNSRLYSRSLKISFSLGWENRMEPSSRYFCKVVFELMCSKRIASSSLIHWLHSILCLSFRRPTTSSTKA